MVGEAKEGVMVGLEDEVCNVVNPVRLYLLVYNILAGKGIDCVAEDTSVASNCCLSTALRSTIGDVSFPPPANVA